MGSGIYCPNRQSLLCSQKRSAAGSGRPESRHHAVSAKRPTQDAVDGFLDRAILSNSNRFEATLLRRRVPLRRSVPSPRACLQNAERRPHVIPAAARSREKPGLPGVDSDAWMCGLREGRQGWVGRGRRPQSQRRPFRHIGTSLPQLHYFHLSVTHHQLRNPEEMQNENVHSRQRQQH
jgi:hypothetical protein